MAGAVGRNAARPSSGPAARLPDQDELESWLAGHRERVEATAAEGNAGPVLALLGTLAASGGAPAAKEDGAPAPASGSDSSEASAGSGD